MGFDCDEYIGIETYPFSTTGCPMFKVYAAYPVAAIMFVPLYGA
jgi:hypothetical protein